MPRRFTVYFISIICTLMLTTTAYAQWQQCNGPYGGWISALAKNGDIIYAGMNEDGLYKSIDSGSTWQYVGLKGNSIRLIYSKDSIIITGNSSSLHRSTDLGKTWIKTKINSIVTGALQLLGVSNQIYALSSGNLYKSNDIGLTWSYVKVEQSEFILAIDSVLYSTRDSVLCQLSKDESVWIRLGLKEYAINSIVRYKNDLIAVTYQNGVFTSSDKGTTWAKISTIPTTYPVVKSLEVMDTVLIAFTAGTGSTGVYRSNDGGYSWIESNIGLSCFSVYGHVIVKDALYIGTSGGGIFRSDTKGQNWIQRSIGLKLISISSFASVNNTLFVGTNAAGIFKSIDYGESWNTVSNGLNDNNILSLITNKSTLIAGAGGYYGGIYSSDNLGDSWDTLGLTRHTIMSIASKGDTIFTGTDSEKGIFRSLNNGKSWQKLTDKVYDCFSMFISDSVVYAGKGGTVNGTIKSTDWGFTWDIIDFGTQTLYMKSFAKLDSLLFFANIEVLKSSDKGVSWKKVLFVNYDIHNIVTHKKNIYLGTGNGIYRSTDLGDTWTSINNGLKDKKVQVLSIVGLTLYAGTQDSGIFKYNLLSTDISVQPSISATQVQCYPNPANDELTITLTSTTELQEPLQYSITNILGESVLQWQQMGSEGTIPIHTLPSGVYYITVAHSGVHVSAMFSVVR